MNNLNFEQYKFSTNFLDSPSNRTQEKRDKPSTPFYNLPKKNEIFTFHVYSDPFKV